MVITILVVLLIIIVVLSFILKRYGFIKLCRRWFKPSPETNVPLGSSFTGNEILEFPKFSSGILQHFSLPKTYILYISKNVSNPKTDKKLLKSCKYFIENNRNIFFHCFRHSNCCFQVCQGFVDKINGKIEYPCKSKSARIDLGLIPYKIVIKNSFCFYSKNSPMELHSLLISSRLICNAFIVKLGNINLSLKEFLLITSSTTFCEIDNVKIVTTNGEYLSIVQVIQIMPNIQDFWFNFIPSFTPIMLQEIEALSKLTSLSINKVPEAFEIEAFFESLKKTKTLQLIVNFDSFKMSMNYQRRIEAIYDQIIKDNGMTYFPPDIFHPDMLRTIEYKKFQVARLRRKLHGYS